jgi:hypothetical protein
MRIHMQGALASLENRRLAAAAEAAARPNPSLPDSLNPPPSHSPPPQPEHESVIWLRAVIEADKATAEAVSDPAEIGMGAEFVDDHGSDEAAEHIRRHDVWDTIARCEAESKLLDLHRPNRYGNCRACDPESCGCTGGEDCPCPTVRTILAGYRHREGFKPEWVSA